MPDDRAERHASEGAGGGGGGGRGGQPGPCEKSKGLPRSPRAACARSCVATPRVTHRGTVVAARSSPLSGDFPRSDVLVGTAPAQYERREIRTVPPTPKPDGASTGSAMELLLEGGWPVCRSAARGKPGRPSRGFVQVEVCLVSGAPSHQRPSAPGPCGSAVSHRRCFWKMYEGTVQYGSTYSSHCFFGRCVEDGPARQRPNVRPPCFQLLSAASDTSKTIRRWMLSRCDPSA